MIARDQLHVLVEALQDGELPAAKRLLDCLRVSGVRALREQVEDEIWEVTQWEKAQSEGWPAYDTPDSEVAPGP